MRFIYKGVFFIVKNKVNIFRYWGGMQDIKEFIGIEGYKKGYLVKITFLVENMYWEGVEHNDFGRYLSISSEIRGIL
jgi:hypothetical protein